MTGSWMSEERRRPVSSKLSKASLIRRSNSTGRYLHIRHIYCGVVAFSAAASSLLTSCRSRIHLRSSLSASAAISFLSRISHSAGSCFAGGSCAGCELEMGAHPVAESSSLSSPRRSKYERTILRTHHVLASARSAGLFVRGCGVRLGILLRFISLGGCVFQFLPCPELLPSSSCLV